MRRSFICCGILLSLAKTGLFAQVVNPLRVPTAAMPFLTIAPDARSAGMGEAGVAVSADANAAYWNAAKLAFAEKDFGASASYTPWLPTLSDDMWVGYATAYKKLGANQALAVSVNYFDNGPELYTADVAINGTYSRQLGKNFSMGLTLKYISSNTDRALISPGVPTESGKVVAADISAYYRKQNIDKLTGKDFTWSLGAVLSNLGGKVNYGASVGDRFIPTTLRIGGGISFAADSRNRFNFIVDASKLMVPTPIDGVNVNNKPLLKGIFGSFGDAPDGFSEEIQEIGLALGAEYWYKSTFALRGGYRAENKNKGNRNYFTAGAGLRLLTHYGVDFAYAIPAGSDQVFAETFRITLSAHFGKSGTGRSSI